jgi:hypothetical protein
MTDERDEREQAPAAGFDDDRLLACALGFDDDPGLVRAAEDDAGLGARLAAMRADVAKIGVQVAATVPAPEQEYTDLSGERWSGLKEYFEPPVTAAKPRRERRWWRVVAPATALAVLALVVGIVAVNQGGQASLSDSAVEGARTTSDASQTGAGESVGVDTGSAVVTGSEPAQATVVERLADQLDRFAIVVLAQAREASGALQRFAVVRIFKGDAPDIVELEVDDEPADAGRLHLLMLDPATTGDEQLGSPRPTPPHATARSYASMGEPLAVSYTYGGEPTMVREFAVGTDPDTVTLPLP